MPVTPTHLKGRNLGYLSKWAKKTDRHQVRLTNGTTGIQADRETDKHTERQTIYKDERKVREIAEQTTGKEGISSGRST
jgi:hypothetical protein